MAPRSARADTPYDASRGVRRHVVVDGSNIATEGRETPSLAQLDEAVQAYMREYDPEIVTVVVDATFPNRIARSERNVYEAAVTAGEIITPPAGAIGRGDAFILQIADKAGATILSNDSFQEFHGVHEWLFQPGRLVGGKPVPHVGWVFLDRTPVRGPLSRRSVSAAKQRAAETPVPPPAVPTTKATKATKAAKAAKAARATEARSGEAVEPSAGGGRPTGSARAGKAARSGEPGVAEAVGDGVEGSRASGAGEAAGAGRAAGTAKAGRSGRSGRSGKGGAAEKVGDEVQAGEAGGSGRAGASKAGNARSGQAEAGDGAGVGEGAGTGRAAKAAKASKAGKARSGQAEAGVGEGAGTGRAAKATKAGKAKSGTGEVDAGAEAAGPGRAAKATKAGKAKSGTGEVDAGAVAAGPGRAGKATKAAKAAKSGKAGARDGGDVAKVGDGVAAKASRRAEAARKAAPVEAPAEPVGSASMPANEALPFIEFVGAHPVGSRVTGVVEQFSSHGAYVRVGAVQAYAPLKHLADPAPRSAKQVLRLGETREFVVVSVDGTRRGVDLALPGVEAAPAPAPDEPPPAQRSAAKKQPAKKGAAKKATAAKGAAKKASAGRGGR